MKTTICNECSRVCALPLPYVLDKREKQIVYDYANVYRRYIELFSYFPTDTTMHPVLKNLGIADKVISFIMGSVNGNKVKTNLLWQSDKWMCTERIAVEAKLNKTLNLINAVPCAPICVQVLVYVFSCEYMSCQRMWRRPSEACMIEG